jgi:DNA mismatch endonuclease (patch repair protein)
MKTTSARSQLMARIRRRNTGPERLLRSAIWRLGFRFRTDAPELPGRPDILLPKWRSAVFVHGCFWHAHEGCGYFQLPKSNADFWREKLDRNRLRDSENLRLLAAMNWRTAIVWECALKRNSGGSAILLADWLRSSAGHVCISDTDGQLVAHSIDSPVHKTSDICGNSIRLGRPNK